MVMHRLTLVISCPAWQEFRVNDSNLLEVLKCKQNLYLIVLQCNKFVTSLNDSVDFKDQLLSLSYLLEICEMSLNYFWAYFSPITMIFFIFQILHFVVSDFKCHFIFQIFWGVLISEGLRILKSCGIKDPQILRISKSKKFESLRI